MVLLPPRTNAPTSLAWLSPLDLKPLSLPTLRELVFLTFVCNCIVLGCWDFNVFRARRSRELIAAAAKSEGAYWRVQSNASVGCDDTLVHTHT